MKYSIITINYNNRDGLERTIQSVINQTCQDFEYIIIDGGSTDGSVDVIKKYADRIDYWVSEPDKGIYNAMNKGILQAHGEYLNFMNSGDCFYNDEVLENIYTLLDSDIVIGKYHKTNEPVPWGFLYDDVSLLDLYVGTFCHQATFIKNDLFINSMYDETYKIISDWKFFVEKLIFENASFRNTEIVIVRYDSTGISSRNVLLMKEERKEISKHFLPKRVMVDYEKLSHVNYCMPLILKLSGNEKFERIVYKVLSILLKLKKIF